MGGVDIGSEEGDEALGEEIVGAFLGVLAVEAEEGGKVELEVDALVVETLVVFVGHVEVAFGMGKDGLNALGLDFVKEAVEVEGGREVGGFEEKFRVPEIGRCEISILGIMEEEVVGVETLEEEVVEHVLGGEVEGDGAGVGSLELLKFGS